jgi:hypothetical protein
MPDPPEDSVAIYDFSGLPAGLGGPNIFGGAPGGGNTVIAARHSSRASGPLLFYRLGSVASGDEVEIVLAGTTFSYGIVVACIVPVASFNAVVRRTAQEVLTLITDSESGPDFRLVAIAERRPGSVEARCPSGNAAGAANPSGTAPTPDPPRPAGGPPPLSLVYESRLPPGSLEGALAASLVYRFRVSPPVSGLGAATFTLAAIGQPDREVRVSIKGDIVDLPFGLNAPPGRYSLAIRLPDGRIASAEFEHRRE